MRSALLATPALALLLATTALAQTASPPTASPPTASPPAATQPPATQAQSEDAAPLMTAPRPDDTATTPSTSSPSGLGGAAPSDEITGRTGDALKGVQDMATAPAAMLDGATARKLVGRDVQTRDGKAAGMIRDFTLAGPEGRVDQVVLSSGAFVGAEPAMVSVPAAELRLDAPESASTPPAAEKPTTRLSLDMTAEELTQARAFAYDGKTKTLVEKR